jgi:hypothetical protein
MSDKCDTRYTTRISVQSPAEPRPASPERAEEFNPTTFDLKAPPNPAEPRQESDAGVTWREHSTDCLERTGVFEDGQPCAPGCPALSPSVDGAEQPCEGCPSPCGFESPPEPCPPCTEALAGVLRNAYMKAIGGEKRPWVEINPADRPGWIAEARAALSFLGRCRCEPEPEEAVHYRDEFFSVDRHGVWVRGANGVPTREPKILGAVLHGRRSSFDRDVSELRAALAKAKDDANAWRSGHTDAVNGRAEAQSQLRAMTEDRDEWMQKAQEAETTADSFIHEAAKAKEAAASWAAQYRAADLERDEAASLLQGAEARARNLDEVATEYQRAKLAAEEWAIKAEALNAKQAEELADLRAATVAARDALERVFYWLAMGDEGPEESLPLPDEVGSSPEVSHLLEQVRCAARGIGGLRDPGERAGEPRSLREASTVEGIHKLGTNSEDDTRAELKRLRAELEAHRKVAIIEEGAAQDRILSLEQQLAEANRALQEAARREDVHKSLLLGVTQLYVGEG